MANWLQKIASPPAIRKETGIAAKQGQRLNRAAQGLPPATIIYGIGASLLFVSSLFLLLSGRWFPALAVFALGACLMGFAVHLLKHQD
jgi:hypothetical protein